MKKVSSCYLFESFSISKWAKLKNIFAFMNAGENIFGGLPPHCFLLNTLNIENG